MVNIFNYFRIITVARENSRLIPFHNLSRALVKKKLLILGSKEIDTSNNSDIYGTNRGLYLSEQERKEKLLEGI